MGVKFTGLAEKYPALVPVNVKRIGSPTTALAKVITIVCVVATLTAVEPKSIGVTFPPPTRLTVCDVTTPVPITSRCGEPDTPTLVNGISTLFAPTPVGAKRT